MEKPKLGFFRWLRCQGLDTKAPRFWEDFPQVDEAGPWVAEALVDGIAFCHVRQSEYIDGGKQSAYIRARELAVDVDRTTPIHPDGEIGVSWGLRRPSEEEKMAACRKDFKECGCG